MTISRDSDTGFCVKKLKHLEAEDTLLAGDSGTLENGGHTELKEACFECEVKAPAFPGEQDCKAPKMTPEEKPREQGPSA